MLVILPTLVLPIVIFLFCSDRKITLKILHFINYLIFLSNREDYIQAYNVGNNYGIQACGAVVIRHGYAPIASIALSTHRSSRRRQAS
jgi:hypothetical protein